MPSKYDIWRTDPGEPDVPCPACGWFDNRCELCEGSGWVHRWQALGWYREERAAQRADDRRNDGD